MIKNNNNDSITFFSNPLEFREWLKENHKKEKEVIVGFYKVKTGKPSMTWSESVDQALCFGWIDGIRKSIDEKSYCIRFTPRNPKSNWSSVNLKKAKLLINNGLMEPEGLLLYKNRQAGNHNKYSYENKPETLPSSFIKIFKANKKAWTFFNLQPPSHKRMIYYWILSAKQESTQLKRLNQVIEMSEQEKRFR